MEAKEGIVYLIRDKKNGKVVYVGSTQQKSIDKRWKDHKYDIKRKNAKLQQAFRENGFENYNKEVILKMKFFSNRELRIVENAYIQIHNTILNGYNNNLASALC
jgi:hypothetical protein